MEIGDPRVYFAVIIEGVSGAANRFLFYLKESYGAFTLDILVSLSRSLATEPRRSRGGYPGVDLVSDGGEADVN